MAARGFFRDRFLLYCFKRNSHISETVFTSTTSVDSLYSRKRVSGVQCSSFKGKTVIDRDGDLERKGWDQRHELILTFSDKLFNATDTGPIKRSMAQNVAESGLSYDDLHKLYTTFGKRALVAILSNPPTTSSARTPRVTRTKRILASIVEHFDKYKSEE